jgi:hypothetical protein
VVCSWNITRRRHYAGWRSILGSSTVIRTGGPLLPTFAAVLILNMTSMEYCRVENPSTLFVAQATQPDAVVPGRVKKSIQEIPLQDSRGGLSMYRLLLCGVEVESALPCAAGPERVINDLFSFCRHISTVSCRCSSSDASEWTRPRASTFPDHVPYYSLPCTMRDLVRASTIRPAFTAC